MLSKQTTAHAHWVWEKDNARTSRIPWLYVPVIRVILSCCLARIFSRRASAAAFLSLASMLPAWQENQQCQRGGNRGSVRLQSRPDVYFLNKVIGAARICCTLPGLVRRQGFM